MKRGNAVVANAPIDYVIRFIVFGCAWHILNGGELRSWMVGAPVAALAAWLSLALRGRRGAAAIRWDAMGLFVLHFLRLSLLGGLDVAARVLRPRLRVAPGFVDFTTSLPEGPARILFVNTISLLPGTLSSGLDGDQITVHSIDVQSAVESDLRKLERAVARAYSIDGGGAE